jgi:hypothetical protein
MPMIRHCITCVADKKSCPAIRHAGDDEERRYTSYSFLTSALHGVCGQRHAPAAIYPRERTHGTHWIGSWVGMRVGLDTKARGEIPCICRGSSPGRPICSQTQY